MRCAWLLLFFLLILPAPSQAIDAPTLPSVLLSGRYTVKIDGMICTSCAKALALEAVKIDGIEAATADFDAGTLLIVVAPKHKVRISKLKKLLRVAARRANLGVHFTIASLTSA